MGSFGQLTITNAGQTLLAKCQAGTASMQFTRMALGDGDIGATDPATLTTLVNLLQYFDINSVARIGTNVTATGTFNNEGAAAPFYYREIGLFAQDPTEGEILYMYGNAGDSADLIPAAGTSVVERSVSITTVLDISATLTVSLASGVYALASDITPINLLTAIKTADGAGSGLDADLFGGHAVNYFQAAIVGAASSIVASNLTGSRVLVSDASGKVAVSSLAATILAYLANITSDVQSQLNAKQATITGGATSIAASNLTASKVLISDASGKVSASSLASSLLAYLANITSDVQAQINGKQPTITGGATSIAASNLIASKVLISDASGKVAVSTLASSILGYLVNITSDVQTQINGKQATITGAGSTIVSNNVTGSRVLISDSSGKVSASTLASSILAYLANITSDVQSQINSANSAASTAQSAANSAQSTANSKLLGPVSGGRILYGSSQPAMNVGDIWLKPID